MELTRDDWNIVLESLLLENDKVEPQNNTVFDKLNRNIQYQKAGAKRLVKDNKGLLAGTAGAALLYKLHRKGKLKRALQKLSDKRASKTLKKSIKRLT